MLHQCSCCESEKLKKSHIRSHEEEVKVFSCQTLYNRNTSQLMQDYHKSKRRLKMSCSTMVESCLLVYVLLDFLP